MKMYKAIIAPTVSGGNIEVKVSANSVSQATGIIKTLPYFKNFGPYKKIQKKIILQKLRI